MDLQSVFVIDRVGAVRFPEFQFHRLAKETQNNLPLELDFVNEGKNCERVAEMFGHLPFLKVVFGLCF